MDYEPPLAQLSGVKFGNSRRRALLGFATRAFSAYFAAPIAHFVSFEFVRGSPLRGWLLPSLWQGATISVLRIEPVVDLTLKVGRPMKPPAGANEDAAIEPFRTVVAVGSAIMRGVVVVTIRAIGGDSNIGIDLSRYVRSARRYGEYSNSG
jgi:hypothetical protein